MIQQYCNCTAGKEIFFHNKVMTLLYDFVACLQIASQLWTAVSKPLPAKITSSDHPVQITPLVVRYSPVAATAPWMTVEHSIVTHSARLAPKVVTSS
jgi:hypothetical protein